MVTICGYHQDNGLPHGSRLPSPQSARPRHRPHHGRAGARSGGRVRPPPCARRPPQEPRRRPERPRRRRRASGGAVARPRPPAVIVADTGAIGALVDADDRAHRALRAHFESDPDAWVLPWAILPEGDYLLAEHVGSRAADAFRADLAAGAYAVELGDEADLIRAQALCTRHRPFRPGPVDGAVAS